MNYAPSYYAYNTGTVTEVIDFTAVQSVVAHSKRTSFMYEVNAFVDVAGDEAAEAYAAYLAYLKQRDERDAARAEAVSWRRALEGVE